MKPQKIYAEVLEESAQEQFRVTMEQDSTVQGALMPDAHTGYTLPIGAVVSVKDYVYPSYVGYDIGCGMCAMKTDFDLNDFPEDAQHPDRIRMMDQIYEELPVGQNKVMHPNKTHITKKGLTEAGQAVFEQRGGLTNLGSLGGGNHFVEVGKDENNDIWIIIHSGSRGVGHGLAHHYMKEASPTGKASEGHYGFHVDSQQGQEYINDLAWGLEFALENRQQILNTTIAALNKVIPGKAVGEMINRNHNHAELKDGLWIHRKGATHAEKGMLGVIPGNMKHGSFIVEGKGNPDSLCSSSHGAGRVLGRKAAKDTLDYDEFIESMQTVTARLGRNRLDEAPKAYKDVFEVMRLQEDLVDVKHYIKPLINIKG